MTGKFALLMAEHRWKTNSEQENVVSTVDLDKWITKARREFPTLAEVEKYYDYPNDKFLGKELFLIWITLSIKRLKWKREWFGDES